MKNITIGSLKSKTMWFSTILVGAGFLEQNFGLVQAIVPEQYHGVALAAIGLITAYLRLVTTKAIVSK